MLTKILTAVFFITLGLYFLKITFPYQGIVIGICALVLGVLALL